MSSLINAALATKSRINRNPTHHWNVKAKPFVVQPIAIAPVLPGETLKNALFQSRVVSDPLNNPLVGWWIEYYWFYCKHRDLAGSEDFQTMMLDLNHDNSAQEASADNTNFYVKSGNINYVEQCLNAVVEEYFRGEGDSPTTIDGLPIAQINQNSWLDSLTTSSAYADGDFDVDLDADTTIEASEVQKSLMHWEFLRANNMTEMSYQDYLGTFGIKTKTEERHVPELLRYVREWTYPVNTIDPSDGSASSAVSWAVSERMDKDRFFKEPGFIFGVSVARPKVYLSAQTASAVGLMSDAMSWLPAIMRDDPSNSLRQTDSSGVLSSVASGSYYDIRDLLIYGDQFTNRLSDDINTVALPDANLNARYAAEADILGMFVSETSCYVKQDGVLRLTILGTQQDMTPRGTPSGGGVI
jgi:hypothetical protein